MRLTPVNPSTMCWTCSHTPGASFQQCLSLLTAVVVSSRLGWYVGVCFREGGEVCSCGSVWWCCESGLARSTVDQLACKLAAVPASSW
jgi:hypothetical protein